MSHEPSLDKTWTFTTEFGCKVLFKEVTADDDSLVKRVIDMTGKDLYTLRVYMDYRHPKNNPDPDVSCGIAGMSLITDDGDEFDDMYVGEYFTSDADGAQLANDLLDYQGASVYRKGWDYAFFSGVKPYTMIQAYPHGIQNSSVFAAQTDEPVPAPSTDDDGSDDYPKAESLEHFSVTVQSRRTSRDVTAYLIKTCVRQLPDDPQGDRTRVSLDPWSFVVGSSEVQAKGDSTFGKAFPAESLLQVGDCAKGWIGYKGTKEPSGVRYSNSLGEVAEF